MPGLVIKNNASGLLQSAISAGATSTTLQAGHTMPALGAGEYTFGTFISTGGAVEVVRVTAISGNVLTHAATVAGFSAGDRFELRPCSQMLLALAQETGLEQVAAATGTDTYAVTLAPVPVAYNTNQLYGARIANANTSSTPTINFNGLGAKNIKKEGSINLRAGDMPAGHAAVFMYDGTNMVLLNPADVVPPSTLVDGATITPDFTLNENFEVTLAGNRTLANPTNMRVGKGGVIKITQDATGGRTLAYGSNWKFVGGTAPTLTATANAVDNLAYYVDGASRIVARLLADTK